MKNTIILIAVFVFATAGISEEATLASKLFQSSPEALALADGGVTAPGRPSTLNGKDPATLQPGKALLLSAILPGAGEYYAGYKLRAAIFFAVEVAAWTGVIYYYNAGMDKDKEFKKFADEHFEEEVYRAREYQLARENQRDAGPYTGTEQEWREESWDEKIKYLPEFGFTHELPTNQDRSASGSQDQQYYEMIGKYIHQFGFGWDDVFVRNPDGTIYNYGSGDNPGTPHYDNNYESARRSLSYMDMRYDSNQLLDRSSLAIQIAMLNHVASALDASFTVRALKRKAEAKVGFRAIDYGGRQVAVGGLNFLW